MGGPERSFELSFRELADAEPQLVWITDPDGSVSYFNRPWYEYTGTTPEENLGWAWLACIHPEDRERIELVFRQAIASGEPYESQYRLRRHDGVYHWFLERGRPVRNAEGRLVHWVGTSTDIEHQKETEAALRIREQRFRSLVHATSAVDWTINPIGESIEENPRWQDFTGQTRAEHRGFGWLNAIHPEDRERVKSFLDAKVREPLSFELEYRLRRHDGVYRWVWARAVPILNPDGSIREWDGACLDIHERVSAQQKMEEERTTLQTVLETMPVGVFLADAKGSLTFANPVARKIWGGPPMVGSTAECGIFKAWRPDTGEPIEPEDWGLTKALRGETTTGTVLAIERFDGTRGTIINNAAPIRDAEGRVLGGIAAFQDITELRRTEDALRLSEERYRAMMTATGALGWRTGAEGSGLQKSPALSAYTGLPTEVPLPEAIHPEDRAKVEQTWAEAVSRQHPFREEYRLRRYDGVYRWFSGRAEPVYGPDGKVREWVGTSVDIDDLKRSKESVEAEVEKRTEELRDVTRSLRVLAETSKAIIHATREEELFDAVCHILIQSGGYPLAWFGLAMQDENNGILPVGCPNPAADYAARWGLTGSEDRPGGQGPEGKAVRSKSPQVLQDLAHNPAFPWRDEASRMGFNSVAVLPILESGQVYGILTIYSSDPWAFGQDEFRLLSQLTNNVSFGLRSIRQRETRIQALTQLRESEERFKNAFDYAAIGMELIAPDGHFLRVNRALCDLLGYTESELLSMTFQEITYAEDLETAREFYARLKAGEIPTYQMEKRYIRKDGNLTWVLLAVSLIRDPEGRPLYAISQAEDINERKRATEELARERGFLSAVLDSSGVSILVSDANGEAVLYNQVARELHGLGQATVPSAELQHYYRLYQADGKTELKQAENPVFRALHEERIQDVVIVIRPIHGAPHWVRCNGRALHDAQGNRIGAVLVQVEITRQLELEAEQRSYIENLRRGEDRLAEAQQLAHLGSWEWDLSTDRMIWSDEEYRLFGLEPGSIEPTFGMLERFHSPENLTHYMDVIEKARENHQPWELDTRILRPDGTVIIAHHSGRVIVDEEGKATRMVGASQDITAIRQADQVKDEFLSVISHELRTPLNAVLGFGSFLEEEFAGPLNEQQQQYVEKILQGADRMLVLVDDLLDFARMQAGKFGISRAETDYPSLVEETIASFQPSAGEKQIRLEHQVDVPQPVCLDRRRIQQVIANLVSNALKFTPTGGWVRIRAWIEGDRLITEVSDNGIGIAPEDLPKLFHAFKQLDMSLTRKAGGVGLGLSISKGIVEAHEGKIEAKSERGKGTTFRFTLPTEGSNP